MGTTMNEIKRLKPEFAQAYIKNLQGKDFMLYNGLVLLAQDKGIKSMNSVIAQFPSIANDNTCIVICTLVGYEKNSDGSLREVSYTGVGDANVGNTNKNVGKHYIRMAETRAKGRALRDFLGIDAVMVEELGDGPFVDNDPNKLPITQQQVGQITALKNSLNMDKDVLKNLAVQHCGTGDISKFSMAMADKLIQAMNAQSRPQGAN